MSSELKILDIISLKRGIVSSEHCSSTLISLAGFHFDTEDGDKVIPGFLDEIIGIKAGETKSFPLFFPESWRQENLRGVHSQFTVSSSLLLENKCVFLEFVCIYILPWLLFNLLFGCFASPVGYMQRIILQRFTRVE